MRVLTLVIAVISLASAEAADYPARPLRLVVGLPAGGGADVMARIVTTKMGELGGRPIVVENRPGSAGRIAAESVSKAAPDGYTLLFGSAVTNAIAPLVYRDLPYDPLRDFTPISTVVTLPLVLVVNLGVPAKSVSELIAYAKAHPKTLKYASSGNGGMLHLTMELLRANAGIDLVHVPYKGGVQAVPDLLSGQVEMMFEILPTQLPYVRSGKTRALAVTSGKRSALLPEIPTMKEAGLRDFEVTMWYALFAPAGVSDRVVRKLSHDLREALAAPDVASRLAQQGADPAPVSPQELAALLREESSRWQKVITHAGVALD